MADCTFLEQSFSHFMPELAGAIVSTTLVAIGLFAFDWRMALAALWVLPISFAIVGFSARVQERMNQKAMDARMACADGIRSALRPCRTSRPTTPKARTLRVWRRRSAPWSIAPSSMSSAWRPLSSPRR